MPSQPERQIRTHTFYSTDEENRNQISLANPIHTVRFADLTKFIAQRRTHLTPFLSLEGGEGEGGAFLRIFSLSTANAFLLMVRIRKYQFVQRTYLSETMQVVPI